MREIIIIKTNESEKLKNLLENGKVNYSIIYDDIFTGLTYNKDQFAAAYEEWAKDPEEQAEIKTWKAVEKDGWKN